MIPYSCNSRLTCTKLEQASCLTGTTWMNMLLQKAITIDELFIPLLYLYEHKKRQK